MFRLVNYAEYDESNTEEQELYRYISEAVSKTIISLIDRYLEPTSFFTFYFDNFVCKEFFSGISGYIQPNKQLEDVLNPDDTIGLEFTMAKLSRMKQKMQDEKNFYTFDLFEEKLLFEMCRIKKIEAKTAEGKESKALLKPQVEKAKEELRNKYKFSEKEANEHVKKMYYADAMLLKKDEDDNLIFWDNDYNVFWEGGFLQGIELQLGIVGEHRGYNYDSVYRMFADIGIKPPITLLGTKEAHRIKNEIDNEGFMKYMDEFFSEIFASDMKKLLQDSEDEPQ